MKLDARLRQTIWSSIDWGQKLKQQAERLQSEVASAEAAQDALAIARAMEALVPERAAAIEMYLTAWTMGRNCPDALARARSLARELGDLTLAAKIARLELKTTRSDELLTYEGVAWLDAGETDRALRPLLEASRRNPGDAAIKMALSTAQREWSDVRDVIARLEKQGEESPEAELGCQSYLQAARIVLMLDPASDRYGRLLLCAFMRMPRHAIAFDLLERHLVQRRDHERLLAMYGARVKDVADARELVETYRRAATALFLRCGNIGLAVRIARKALEHAYQHGLRDIPGHLALFELMRRYLEKAGNLPAFLPLIEQGAEHAASDDERLWFAVQGMQIAWGLGRDRGAASRFAGVVRALCPEHPLLGDFPSVPESAPAMADTAPVSDSAWQVDGLSTVYLDTVQHDSRGVAMSDAPVGLAAARPSAPEPEPEFLDLDPEPETDDRGPTTEDRGPTTEDRRPTTDDRGPRTDDRRPTTDDRRPSTDDRRPRTDDRGPTTEPEPETDFAELTAEIMAGVAEPLHSAPTSEPKPVPDPERDLVALAPEANDDLPAVHEPSPPPPPAKELPLRPASPHLSLIPRAALSALSKTKPARARRVECTADISIHFANGQTITGVARDISTSGVFFATDNELETAAEVECTLSLQGNSVWSVEEFRVRARVARSVSQVGYGLAFIDPPATLVAAIRKRTESQ